MRVILAALFFFIAMTVGIIGIVNLAETYSLNPVPKVIAMLAYIGVLFVITMFIFNKNRRRLFSLQSTAQYVAELEQKGELVHERHELNRALSFDDLNTGCLVYFIETKANHVLCLYGQYLHEYAEITDDEEMNQPRRFPTESFTLLRSRDDNEIIDMQPEGKVLEPLMIEDPDYSRLYELGVELIDGKIYPDISLDEISAALT